MSDTNEMRREFEAWCKVRGGISTFRDSTPLANGGTNQYQNAWTNHAWWGWQAATERAAKVCENKRVGSAHDTDEFQVGYNMGVNDCAVAIRQGDDT